MFGVLALGVLGVVGVVWSFGLGTVSIEVSLDKTHWLPTRNADLTGMTGGNIPKASLEVIEESVKWIRANTTEYTSGEARIVLNGIPEQ